MWDASARSLGARAILDAGFTALEPKCSLEDDVVTWCGLVADRAPGLRRARTQRVDHAAELAGMPTWPGS